MNDDDQHAETPSRDNLANELTENTLVPAGRLHSLRGITWATLLGGPLLTLLLVTVNYRRLRMGRETILSLSSLLMAFFAYCMWLISIPEYEDRPDSFFYAYLPFVLVTLVVAICLQRDLVNKHRRLGGVVLSAWDSVFVVFLCYVALIALACTMQALNPSIFNPEDVVDSGGEVVLGEDSVFFIGNVRDHEAYRLAEALRDLEHFQDDGRAVQLSRVGTQHVVSFVLSEGAWHDSDVHAYYRRLGQQLLTVLDWDTLVIRIVDGEFESHQEFLLAPE